MVSFFFRGFSHDSWQRSTFSWKKYINTSVIFSDKTRNTRCYNLPKKLDILMFLRGSDVSSRESSHLLLFYSHVLHSITSLSIFRSKSKYEQETVFFQQNPTLEGSCGHAEWSSHKLARVFSPIVLIFSAKTSNITDDILQNLFFFK